MKMPTSVNEPNTPAFEEISGAVKPVITALDPDTCAIGGEDFTLYITGEGFSESTEIYFANQPEPTTLNADGTVSTGVKPSLWGSPVTVGVGVHNGTLVSNIVNFEFTEAGAAGDELPSDTELARMTRSELDDLAYAHDVDISHASNKDDVIALLRKAERKNKRKHR
jgi:hypothetical protein